MLHINDKITIEEWELTEQFTRSQGPGGQNVNKVSSALHLRFDIRGSSLPAFYKERLLALRDSLGEPLGGGGMTSVLFMSDELSACRAEEKESRERVLDASTTSSGPRSSLPRPLPRFDTPLIIFPNERNMVAVVMRCGCG